MTKGFGRFLRQNTIALLALFLVLGGTSYAAATAINGKLIKPNSIPKNRLTKGAIKSLKGNRGPAGPQGLQGPQGPPGAPNPNADTLNGFAANQLVRATAASAGNTGDPCGAGPIFGVFQSTTFTDLVSKAITAPVGGVLVITGRIASEYSSGSSGTIRLLGRLAIDGVQAGPQSETSLSSTTASCQEGRTMAMTAAVAVAAGDHTVALQAAKSTTTGGTGAAYIGNASFTTVFVPFGNAGTQGVLGATRAASLSGGGNR